ncbi:MAG: sigma 54-interacting transcriptional regulator, partial [Syntrophaceae bacterium]|nr:sigma 54-interacting transcriptional regulator [Syntrophaceae bacterium]
TANPVFNGSGKISYVIVNLRDITKLIKWYEDIGYSSEISNRDRTVCLNSDLANLPDYGLIVHNRLMRQCISNAIHVAEYDIDVVILGESGTGKSLLSQVMHKASTRSHGPFLSINCGSIPANLLETELYGYEKGAFTGASEKGKKGLLEYAVGGTLVLDEVSELPMEQQVKLLKTIEERQIFRVGGGMPVDVDVRIIAVSNRNLKTMVDEGRFREDLYFRLNVVPITIPALRERKDEIPLLTKHFFTEFNKKYSMEKFPSDDLIQQLCRLNFKGNVRELKNIIERLMIMSHDSEVTVHELRLCCGDEVYSAHECHMSSPESLQDFLEKCEREMILKTIKDSETFKEACNRLGISKVSLWRKLNKYGYKKKMVIRHEHSVN